MIAWNRDKRNLQWRKQMFEVVVFLLRWRVGKIARNDDKVRQRHQAIQLCHAPRKGGCCIDLAIC